MSDPSDDPSSPPASPELAGLVLRTQAAMRGQPRADHASPTPSWAVSIRFRLAGFRPRSTSQR